MRGARKWVGIALLLALGWPEDAAAQERRRSRRDRDRDEERGGDEERAGGRGEEAGRDRGDEKGRGRDEEETDPSGYDDWRAYAMRDSIAFEAWWWSADTSGSTFAFALGGQSMMTDNVAVAFHLPWTFNVRSGGDPVAASGNPTLDFHYVDQASIVTWHVGGGLSAPLASIQDDFGAYRVAAGLGTSALAAYDSYLFVPAYMPVRAYGGVELRAAPGISIRLGLDPILFVPLESQDVEVILQEHADVIALTPSGFGGGLRLQGAHPLTDDTDMAQLSLEPYLAYDDSEHFFTKLGLLMALDTPLGFAFEQQKVLALHFTIGGYTGSPEEHEF